MARKKWTPQPVTTESLLKFRDKRKWQIALRRYIFEKNPSIFYAPFFGIDIKNIREWIELQFDSDLNWENFSKKWQFDHIIPVTYFDFADADDLRLCWNFTNIRVQKIDSNKNHRKLDVLASKGYFKALYEKTGYPLSLKMIEKITRLEMSEIASTEILEDFLINNKNYLETISGFSSYEFEQLNYGLTIDQILKDRELLRRFD